MRHKDGVKGTRKAILGFLGAAAVVAVLVAGAAADGPDAESGPLHSAGTIAWEASSPRYIGFAVFVFWWIVRVVGTIAIVVGGYAWLKQRNRLPRGNPLAFPLLVGALVVLWLVPARPRSLVEHWQLTRNGIDTPSKHYDWNDIKEITLSFKATYGGTWQRTGGGTPFAMLADRHGEIELLLKNGEQVTEAVPVTMTPWWQGADAKAAAATRQGWTSAAKDWAPTIMISRGGVYSGAPLWPRDPGSATSEPPR